MFLVNKVQDLFKFKRQEVYNLILIQKAYQNLDIVLTEHDSLPKTVH